MVHQDGGRGVSVFGDIRKFPINGIIAMGLQLASSRAYQTTLEHDLSGLHTGFFSGGGGGGGAISRTTYVCICAAAMRIY